MDFLWSLWRNVTFPFSGEVAPEATLPYAKRYFRQWQVGDATPARTIPSSATRYFRQLERRQVGGVTPTTTSPVVRRAPIPVRGRTIFTNEEAIPLTTKNGVRRASCPNVSSVKVLAAAQRRFPYLGLPISKKSFCPNVSSVKVFSATQRRFSCSDLPTSKKTLSLPRVKQLIGNLVAAVNGDSGSLGTKIGRLAAALFNSKTEYPEKVLKELLQVISGKTHRNHDQVQSAFQALLEAFSYRTQEVAPETMIAVWAGKSVREIPAAWLVAQSDFFATALSSQMSEATTKMIHLRAEIFDLEGLSWRFLEYVATARTRFLITAENAPYLLQLAQQYQLEALSLRCEKVIAENIQRETVMDILSELALPFRLQALTMACIQCIQNASHTPSPEEWQHLAEMSSSEDIPYLSFLCGGKKVTGLSCYCKGELSGGGSRSKENGIWLEGVSALPVLPQLVLDGWFKPPLAIRVAKLDAAQMIELASFIQRHKTLTKLKISESKVVESVWLTLIEALSQVPFLHEIAINQCEINHDIATAIAGLLRTSQTLTVLYLPSNQIGNRGASALAEALKINKTLTSLVLNFNKIGSPGAQSLAEMLAHNTRLNWLSLGDNLIDDETVPALVNGLGKNKTLTSLNLSYNKFRTGAGALGEMLAANQGLSYLWVSNNGLGDLGAIGFAAGLKKNINLKTLSLNNCNIGDQGATALAEALETHPCLTNLDLSNGGAAQIYNMQEVWKIPRVVIGSRGAEALQHLAIINKRITHIYLSRHGVSEESLEALESVLKENRALQKK